MNRYDTDLAALLPPWYREILDYQALCTTQRQELEALARSIDAVEENFFCQSMDGGAVEQWEQIFHIAHDPAAETLQFRRARILNRLSTRPPFTLAFLSRKLNELIGENAWSVWVDYPNHTLYVESGAENQSYATEVAYTIQHIKPAHIVYVNKPYTVSGLLLHEEISLSQRVYHYRLGGWGLGLSPFATETSKGVIKTATTPSVQPELLSGVANFLSAHVASARINGSVAISDLTKTVSNGTLTVSYTVPQAQAEEITRVALLSADGDVLTESQIYVPVSGSTVLTHKIPIAEGVTSNG